MQRREVLQAAAAVARVVGGDVPDVEITAQQNRLLDLANRDDAGRWACETTRNFAHVRSGLVSAELDARCEEPTSTIGTHSVGRGDVPLTFGVSTDDKSAGTLVHLSAKQAKALTVDLLEQAHAAKEDHDANQ